MSDEFEMPELTKVYCCREWEVIAFLGWGNCGICGNKPMPPGEIDLHE